MEADCGAVAGSEAGGEAHAKTLQNIEQEKAMAKAAGEPASGFTLLELLALGEEPYFWFARGGGYEAVPDLVLCGGLWVVSKDPFDYWLSDEAKMKYEVDPKS